ncbi:hypothetical protein [Rubrivirga sp.]|uniref:hypothetical protein n=1 Tax=Rubrivirga sp. TaxID=1885344 RepID=UPI003C73463F
MAQLCRTPTHVVDHLRRGLYRLVVFDKCPNPTGRHLVVWYRGNRRGAFHALDRLLALPVSFRGSGQPLPALDSSAPASSAGAVSEPPSTYGSALRLGRVVTTTGALEVARDHGVNLVDLVRRHQSGDWGTLSAHDRRANEKALRDGSRVMSVYPTAGGRLWVVTEAGRSSTTVLLPSEY